MLFVFVLFVCMRACVRPTRQVAVAARRLDRLDALVEELNHVERCAGVCAVRMDVQDESSVKTGVNKV